MAFKAPAQGFVFWPVGSGDSTTIKVDSDHFLQVDLRHMASAEDKESPSWPVIDELLPLLPKKGEKRYLSVFALTHPDQDHCLGFKELLGRSLIGELWFSPRVFREYKKDLCEDAQAFQAEAKRRVKKVIANNGNVSSGDRVRIIGYDELLSEEEFKGFPRRLLTIPGSTITELDNDNIGTKFKAFVHAPFKDDADGDRNDTSLAFQITLSNNNKVGRLILLGDHCYPTLKRIFNRSKAGDLEWNVFLSPHHCSKSAMFWKEESDREECLKQDIMDKIKSAMAGSGYIIASSRPVPATDTEGALPPHAKAKEQYLKVTQNFLCTQEHPNKKSPEPIVFEMTVNGLTYNKPDGTKAVLPTLAEVVAAARGASEPPKQTVGFGRC